MYVYMYVHVSYGFPKLHTRPFAPQDTTCCSGSFAKYSRERSSLCLDLIFESLQLSFAKHIVVVFLKEVLAPPEEHHYAVTGRAHYVAAVQKRL